MNPVVHFELPFDVLGEPMDIPGVCSYVAFFDTEHNSLSMLQPLPPTGPAA